MVGVNCHFDMFVALETMKKMKAGLQAAGLHPYLMMQPVMTALMTMKMRMILIIIIIITMETAMVLMIMISILTITFADCLPVPRRREARNH